MQTRVLTFDILNSTNTEALEQARQGADEGLCIVARQQTAGRGRHSRVWVSPPDAGLYFSIILRPKIEMRFFPLITLMTGVAVFETVKSFGISPDIKWVNDVLVDERKIAGILAETTETSKGLAVIVGIGINLRTSEFPHEADYGTTSIEAETSRPVDKQIVLTRLIKNFGDYYEELLSENGTADIIRSWSERSSYASGKYVTCQLENRTITGVTNGVDASGALQIKDENGTIHSLTSGEIKKLRKAVGN